MRATSTPALSSAHAGTRSKPTRVALIAFSFADYSVPIANAVAERTDVRLYLPSSTTAGVVEEVSPRVDLVLFDKPRLRQPWRQFRACLSLIRSLRAYGPDVVHLQQGHFWFNLFLPLLGRRPLVLTIHDHEAHLGDRDWKKTPQQLMELGFRRADRVIVHAQALSDAVIAGGHVPADRVHVVPSHGARAGAGAGRGQRPTSAAAGSEERRDGATVLFFGRIWAYKGLGILIAAEPLITGAVPSARIIIAGEGEDFAPYRAAMVHPERFEVHNTYLSNDERAALFERADVVVLPYLEATQSGVVPLAYEFARPVVATSVGGLPELVKDGHTGSIVPPGDERALADAIVRLLQDPELATRLGRNGREYLFAEFSSDAIADRTMAVYERALQPR